MIAIASPFSHCLQKCAAFVPHAEIQLSESMQVLCRFKVQSSGNAPAIGGPAQRWRPVMDTALVAIQIYALPIRLVCKHQCAPDIRVWFCQKVVAEVFVFKSDGITLTTQSASATRYFFSREWAS